MTKLDTKPRRDPPFDVNDALLQVRADLDSTRIARGMLNRQLSPADARALIRIADLVEAIDEHARRGALPAMWTDALAATRCAIAGCERPSANVAPDHPRCLGHQSADEAARAADVRARMAAIPGR